MKRPEPEQASIAGRLGLGDARLRQHDAVSAAGSVTPQFLVTFPIGFDAGIDDFTTQQALPADEARCRAFRLLQSGGHHQALTTSAVHLLTSQGATQLAESVHPFKVHHRTE